MSVQATLAALEAKGAVGKLEVSPYTGKLTVYTQYLAPTVITQSAQLANLNAWKNVLTNEFAAQGADGFCDSVSYRRGLVSDTYYSRLWQATSLAADGQLVALGTDGLPMESLVIPVIIISILTAVFVTHWVATAALIGIAVIVAAIVYLVIHLTTEKEFTATDPSTGLPVTGTKLEILSKLQAEYWYVCPKDMFVVGSKAEYATPSEVPLADRTLFTDHCNSADDLFGGDGFSLWPIVIPIIAVLGVYTAAKVVPGLMRKT